MILPGDVAELRIFEKDGKKYCGWFDNSDRMAEAALSHDDTAEGIYYTLNACKKEMLAIANNRLIPCKTASNEQNIERRRVLGFDIDPVRNPTKISSTDAEKALARLRALEVIEWLSGYGFPKPVLGDSGNGYHTDYFVDLPNNPETKKLYEAVYKAVQAHFPKDAVDVQGFADANRIWKVYGTVARKGENMPDRPHRRSKLLEVPDKREIVTVELLEKVAALVPKKDSENPKSGKSAQNEDFKGNGKAWNPEKLKTYLEEHGAVIEKTKTDGDITRYVLTACLMNPEHTGSKEAEAHIDSKGMIGYKCHHNSCNNVSWVMVREKLEPGYRESKNGNGKVTEPDIEYEPDPLKEQPEEIQERRIKIELPEDHFISQYMKWGASVTDAYPEYNLANALWLLSAATNRKVILKLRQEYIRPNLWIMTLGNSTTSRKSTAVNKARKLFESATGMSLPNDDFSLEGYLESLSESPIMHNVKDEASGLLAKYHQRYNDGIFDFECTIYDGSPETLQKRLSSGKAKTPKIYVIKDYYVTKLYATTPDKLAHCMTISDFMCGYGYRWIYNYPKYKHDRKPLEMEEPEDVTAWQNITGRIRTFYNLFKTSGTIEFKVSKETMQYYDNICVALENKAEEQNNDILNSVIGRAQVHILKIAMLLELGKSKVSTTITDDSIKIASEMVTDFFIPSIMETIDRMQEDIKNNLIEKITSILRRLGGTSSHTKLLRDSNMKSKEFFECISTMIESYRIKIEQDKPRVYKLLNHNSPLNFRSVRKVRNVRTCIEGEMNPTNITKTDAIYAEIFSYIPLRTNERYEQNERYEDPILLESDDVKQFFHANYAHMNRPNTKNEQDYRKMQAVNQIATRFKFTKEKAEYIWQDYCSARCWLVESVAPEVLA